jgi:NADPH:quinone reductase-like Zn-dependent oxidoreductase
MVTYWRNDVRQWILKSDVTTAEGLVLEEAPAPEPGPGQVRVRVTAISLNARDAMILAGPFGRVADQDVVPMSDVAGVIDRIGPDIAGWRIGDRVMTAHVPSWVDGPPPLFAQGPGSNADPGVAAEYVLVDEPALVRTPEHLDDVEASSLQVAGVTAWNAVFGSHAVAAGDTVAVIGSGGVSLYAAQLARTVGASVHVVTRGADLDPRWNRIGVAGHLPRTPGWGRRLAELSGGIRTVVNAIGPGATAECLDAAANGGEVAVPGLVDLTPPALDLLDVIARQLSVRGVAVGSVRMHRDLADFMTEHRLHPVIDTVLPFDQLPRSYAVLATPGTFGKVVLRVP